MWNVLCQTERFKLSRIGFVYDVWFWFFFCFIFANIRRIILACWLVLKMAQVFNWFRPGYELINVKFQWNVQVPFLPTADGQSEVLRSSLFSSQKTPNSQWELEVNVAKTQITICTYHYDSAGELVNFDEPVQVKMSILNKRGKKALQKMLELAEISFETGFYFSKKEIIESDCQQSDGSLTFCCKILTHVKKELTSSSADPSVFTVDCSGGLSTHLDGLFNNMQFSDVNFNIGGREFPPPTKVF